MPQVFTSFRQRNGCVKMNGPQYFSEISAILHRIGLVFFSKRASESLLFKCINSKVLNEFIAT